MRARRWLSPQAVVAAGVAAVVCANVLEGPCMKTTLLAAAPVGLLWFIYLHVLPSQFRSFAIDWIQEHEPPPEQRTTSGRAR